jgi:hypothetical protein
MRLRTNARIAGATLLLYIATGVASMVLMSRVEGVGTAARLAAMEQHEFVVRTVVILTLIQAAYAAILGITFYALTRDEDGELAIMAMCCRVAEGVVIVLASIRSVALLSIATGTAAVRDDGTTLAIAGMLMRSGGWSTLAAATCFAAGSLIFSWLLLRSRSIPGLLAWTGVIASGVLVVALPLQLAGFVHGRVTDLMWIPMIFFEVPVAIWLLIKGVAVKSPVVNEAGA